ncbi:site-specific integrase, partial [Streptomyces sp. A73]|nr:site-specific integrase [Streptomyces sp. A73]
AERLKNQSKPKNTSRTYRNQRDLFEAWCTREGRVAKPCTTTTYVEYVAELIESGKSPNSISVAMSAIRTWMPDDKKPGTQEAR